MSKHPETLPARRSVLTSYVLVWCLAGAVSVAYLAAANFAPGTFGLGQSAAVADAFTTDAGAQLTSEVRGISDSMVQVQDQIGRLNGELRDVSEREKSLADKIAAIEQTVAATASAALPAKSSDRKPAAPSADTSRNGDAGRSADAAPSAPTVINPQLDDPDALTTGSLSGTTVAKPKSPAKTVATANQPAVAGPPRGLQLASGPSIDAARLSWMMLSDRHGDLLQGLQPRYVDKGTADSPRFELVAGPIKSPGEAARLCKALAAQNAVCKVGDYNGVALQ